MAVNQSYPTGYVDVHCFRRIDNEFFIYHSPIRHREYELHLINNEWNCNCPDKRHNDVKCCKHEQALARLWKQHQTRKSLSMSKAEMQEQIAALATEIGKIRAEWKKADLQTADALRKFALGTNEKIAALRAEIEALRAELAELRAAPIAPDLAAIMQELEALKQENTEIKRVLATKATARRKHMSETEAAQAKEAINTMLDNVVEQSQNAIKAAEIARQQIKDLEAIPYELKAELDRWTEAGKEELQPDYQPPDLLEPELKASIREAQEATRKRRKREEAPLNGNQGFSLLK